MRNRFPRQHLRWLLALLATLFTTTVMALPEDNQQPINIQADRATQQSTGNGEKTEYFGHVVMTQGSLKVNADHVIIHSVNRQVTQIEAIGTPAHLQQQSDPNKAPVQASANNIDYELTTETVVLTDNAHIDQPDASFKGNHLKYNVATEEVVAEQRVNMVFTPAKRETPQAANPAAAPGTAPNAASDTAPEDTPATADETDKDKHGDSAGP